MASFTRKFLKGMSLTDEQVEAIIDSHAEVVSGLKDEIDKYKAESARTAQIEAELKEAKEQVASTDKDAYKAKYEALKEDFDAYKEEQAKKAEHEEKKTAYRQLLKDIGITEKRIDTVLKCCDIDSIELGKDGKIKDVSELQKSLKEEWSDFIQTTETHGADTPNPPEHKEGAKEAYDKMSLAEKMQYANEHPADVAEWNKQRG